MSLLDVKDARSARIGESARYFAANQPMRYGIERVYSLELEHCICLDAFTSYVVVVRSSATWAVVILLVHSDGFACVWSPV